MNKQHYWSMRSMIYKGCRKIEKNERPVKNNYGQNGFGRI
jgi:hypothetical protein